MDEAFLGVYWTEEIIKKISSRVDRSFFLSLSRATIHSSFSLSSDDERPNEGCGCDHCFPSEQAMPSLDRQTHWESDLYHANSILLYLPRLGSFLIDS